MKQLIILFCIFPASMFAQKSVDLDKFRFRVQYRSLPSQKIDSTYHTYDVAIEGTKLMRPFLMELSPAESVKLAGWRRLEKSGHLSVQVKLGDLLPGDVAVKERIQTTKNGNGQVTGTKTFYYQEMSYTFEAAAAISDFHGAHVRDIQLFDRNYKRIYKSPEFAVKQMAETYFVVNSLTITKDLYRQCVTQSMHSLSGTLTSFFGFDEVTANDFMWVVGSRKHPEYRSWRNALQQMNEVLFSMTASKPIDGARKKLQSAIAYFEKIRRDYSSSGRHDRKIRYASYYNLAVMYYYLDDPDAMMREANGLILNDFDQGDGKAFANNAMRLRNLFEQTNIYTRHFSIDVNSFKGPYEVGQTAGAVK